MRGIRRRTATRACNVSRTDASLKTPAGTPLPLDADERHEAAGQLQPPATVRRVR